MLSILGWVIRTKEQSSAGNVVKLTKSVLGLSWTKETACPIAISRRYKYVPGTHTEHRFHNSFFFIRLVNCNRGIKVFNTQLDRWLSTYPQAYFNMREESYLLPPLLLDRSKKCHYQIKIVATICMPRGMRFSSFIWPRKPWCLHCLRCIIDATIWLVHELSLNRTLSSSLNMEQEKTSRRHSILGPFCS